MLFRSIQKMHLLLAVLCISQVLYCQRIYAQDKSVEVQYSSNENYFYTIPVSNQVILLYPEYTENSPVKSKWIYMAYDKDLSKLYEKSFELPQYLELRSSMGLYSYSVLGSKVYLLFAEMERVSDEFQFSVAQGNIQVVVLNALDGQLKNVEGKLPFNCHLDMIAKKNGNVYLVGGSVPTVGQQMKRVMSFSTGKTPQEPLIMEINTNNSKNGLIPIHDSGKVFIRNAEYDTISHTINYLVSNQSGKSDIDFMIRQLSDNDSLTNKIALTPQTNKTLNTGVLYSSKEGVKYVVGAYSAPIKSQVYYYLNLPLQGIYIDKITSNDKQQTSFYPFYKFNDFCNLSCNDAAINAELRRCRHSAEKEKEGEANLRILPHRLIECNNQIVFIGEVYYPSYHQNYNGRSWIKVFDGWRFLQAIVAAFDKDGNMKWNKCFEITSAISPPIKEHVKVYADNDKIVLTCVQKGKILSQFITENGLVEKSIFKDFDISRSSIEVKEDYGTDIEHWYENNFVVFTRKKVKTAKKDNGPSNNGAILYMRKIVSE